MDQELAQIFNTEAIINGEAEQEDVTKTAAAEFLVKLAEQEGVDLDSLSDQEVGELLQEIEGDMQKEASGQDDEALEKFAEAEFLGRAMAHAYVNELSEIEKQAGPKWEAAKAGVGKAWQAAGKWTGASGIRKGLKARSELVSAAREGAKVKGLEGKVAKEHIKGVLKAHKTAPSRVEMREGLKRMGKRVGAPAAGLAALGGGAAYATKKSADEQFEQAAAERAYEMLADAGYDVEKIAQADVQQQLDYRALEMLQKAGYPVE